MPLTGSAAGSVMQLKVVALQLAEYHRAGPPLLPRRRHQVKGRERVELLAKLEVREEHEHPPPPAIGLRFLLQS